MKITKNLQDRISTAASYYDLSAEDFLEIMVEQWEKPIILSDTWENIIKKSGIDENSLATLCVGYDD